MIKNSFLKNKIEAANKEKKTPEFLRHLIFLVVDRALKHHYCDTYSERCLQSSLAISMVLEKFVENLGSDLESRKCFGSL